MARWRRRTWTVLFLERLAPAVGPALGVAGLFLALAWMGALHALPPALHLGVLAALGLAFFGLLVRGVSRLRPPSARAVAERLERDSHLSHRPLRSAGDPLALGRGNPVSRALWAAHRRQQRRAARRLRLAGPDPVWTRHDPWGLRVLVVLLLIIGGAAAWPHLGGRLVSALDPRLAARAGTPVSVDLWITPPGYTDDAPRHRHWDPGQTPAPVPAPMGSEVQILVQGPRVDAHATLDGTALDTERLGPESQRLTGFVPALPPGAPPPEVPLMLVVREGARVLARWPLALDPDQPPEVAFMAPPQGTPRGVLEIAYRATDDHGLVGLELALTGPAGHTEHLPLPVPPPGRTTPLVTYEDLSAHRWAGRQVAAQLVAHDAARQEAVSTEHVITLPERPFEHPVAAALVRLRRQLQDRPGERLPIVGGLEQLGLRPAAFDHDVVVSLGLSSLAGMLRYGRTLQAEADAAGLMWQLALHLEEGALGLAEAALQRARDNLAEALDRHADAEELERHMTALRQAMDQYLQAVRERMAERPLGTEDLSEDLRRVLTPRDLDQMLDTLEALTQTGNRTAARDMLRQLDALMSHMSLPPGGAQDLAPQARALAETLRSLSTLRQEQLALARQGGGEADAAARAQRQLARRLREALDRMAGSAAGTVPEALETAAEAMDGAARALGQGHTDRAGAAQRRALENLAEGTEAALRQLMEQLIRAAGQAPGGMRDPLGRPLQGAPGGLPGLGEGLTIPDASALSRSRSLLEQLRQRVNDPARPDLERQYLDRLLTPF